jgi:hypothetical protein
MSLPQPIMITFRDGERSVPPHVASNISVAGIDPLLYSFSEAIKLTNNAIERNFINNFAQDTIYKHFRDNR